MFGVIHLCKCLVLDFFLDGSFYITDSLSLLIGLFIFSISSWFNFGRLYISKNLSISSRLSILLAYNCSNLFWSFVFLSYHFELLFNFWFYPGPLSFCLPKSLSILFIFSKNQLLVSLIFFFYFLISISFIHSLIFIISFLLLALGFFCSSFSNCFRCKVRLFIWDVSCFLR